MLEPKQAIVFIDVPFVVIVPIPAKLVEILAFILYHENQHTITRKTITMVIMKGTSASYNVSKPLAQQLISLAKKILIIVAISWISLYLLGVILPSLGVEDVIVQITRYNPHNWIIAHCDRNSQTNGKEGI